MIQNDSGIFDCSRMWVGKESTLTRMRNSLTFVRLLPSPIGEGVSLARRADFSLPLRKGREVRSVRCGGM